MVANKTRSKRQRGGENNNNNSNINNSNFYTARSGPNNQARNFENIEVPAFPMKEEKKQTNTRKINKKNVVKNFNAGMKTLRNTISEMMALQNTIKENQKRDIHVWTKEGQELLLRISQEHQLNAQQMYELVKKLKHKSLQLINQGKFTEFEEILKQQLQKMEAYKKKMEKFDEDFEDIYMKHLTLGF